MDLFIFLIGFLLIVGSFITLVIFLFRKKNLKKPAVALGIGFVLAITGLAMPSSIETDSVASVEDEEVDAEEPVEEEEPIVEKEQLILDLVEASHDTENNRIVIKLQTNLADGIEVYASIKGEEKFDYPVIPNSGVVENGEVTILLGEDEPIPNGSFPIVASFGSHGNEQLTELYGQYEDFIENYEVPGSVTKTDIGYNVENISLGDLEITEGLSEEALEQQRLQAKKSEATELSFAQLNKNPDRHVGEYVKYTGEIVQIQEGDDWTVIRLAVTKDSYGYNYNDIIWVEYEGYTDFVDEDIVTVYGTIFGSHSYTSQAGWEITLPAMLADIVE